MDIITVGMAQLLVEGGQAERNVARACQRIAEASKRGCDVVVFPECIDAGWTHPSVTDIAMPIPGKTSDALCKAAKQHKIHVVAGITERDVDKSYNAAILVSPEGNILLKHRKITTLYIEQKFYATGDSIKVAPITVKGTTFKVGINICADNFPGSLCIGHALARMGARAIFSPSAWAVDADHDNQKEPYGGIWKDAYGELSRLYDIGVVGVSNVGDVSGGPWAGRICIGNSLAFGPGGEIVAQGTYGKDADELVVAKIEVIDPGITGVNILNMLKIGGYNGP
jgi:predicted amidohydrolase